MGHLGLKHFIKRHPGLVPNAHVWIHLGANIGETNTTNRLQASNDELERIAVSSLAAVGVTVNDKAHRGEIPYGEAGGTHCHTADHGYLA